jgi:hypothetical protein
MKPAEPGADDTVRILPQRPRRRTSGVVAVATVIVALLAGSGTAWLLWPRPAAPPAPIPAPMSAPAPVATAQAPAFPIETADEQQIREHLPTDLTVFRFAGNPRILVLDFASLHEQGLMLNRVAAMVEKAGLPHDRVLTDDELDKAIRAQGETVETFYYGHDYAASALVRFFALADEENVELNAQEEKLRALLRQAGWFAAGNTAGLISVPAIGSDAKITASAREAILRHELSHGEFFSNPAYAAYVHSFWMNALTELERGAFRRFLAKEQYDAGDEELMYNEMQAYLMFTRDRLFFSPAMAGLSDARLTELRRMFLGGMPQGWLRDVLASYQDEMHRP